MTIVKFTQHSGYTYYHTDWDGDMSGEYVPLTEYQDLKTHMESLTKESYELKGLLRRVINIGPEVFDDITMDFNEKSSKLVQLLRDCRGAL